MEDEMGVKCVSCGHMINPYEEKVHVWNGWVGKIFLCQKCNDERSGGENIPSA